MEQNSFNEIENIKQTPYVMSITSGKGGVGKSVLTSNLAWALADSGKKVLVWDANIYFPNQHLIFGVEPPVRLSAVYSGHVSVSQALFNVSPGLYLLSDLPAGPEKDDYSPEMISRIYVDLIRESDFDIILIDTPPAGSREVLECAAISDNISIIVTDEPTSLLDAYGLIKIFIKYFSTDRLSLIVNNVIDNEDADEVTTKLNLATDKFLSMNINNLGYIPYDRMVRQSILRQELYMTDNKGTEVSRALHQLAGAINNMIDVTNDVDVAR